MIQIRSLSKSFQSGSQRLQVLRGLELDLKEGSMLAVTGESGSGKSTFLHLLGGMEKPGQGQIRVGGQDIAQLSGKALACYRNRMIGFVFQFHHLLPEFSAVENVMFPLLLRGQAFGEARRQALQRLEEAGLADRAAHRPGQLSGGEQQRVAVARALVGRPRILLADEPTGDLDERTSDAIHQLLVGVHKSYALTSVIVTHNPRLAGLCGRQLCMREGKLQDP
ncbi:MAG: ABC transporter ATP-binding protein [Acidobacteriota bacterium]